MGTKSLVPFYRNNDVFQCRINSLVFEYADAWSDKYLLAYIIPGIVAPYNIILVKTYIESIPKELEESAKIDGASHIRIFAQIILAA